MFGSELRTCGLGAVFCVLLGAGIGLGWHYLDNDAGRTSGRRSPLKKGQKPLEYRKSLCDSAG